MFFRLSISGIDYVTRIERLFRRFDREDVYQDNLLRQLDKLRTTRGENEDVLERAAYAIKMSMDNSSHRERSSRRLLDTLEDHLPESMLRQYNFDLRMSHQKHSATRLTQWLEVYLESLVYTRQMKRGLTERQTRFKPPKETARDQVQSIWGGTPDGEGETRAMVTQEGGGGPCNFCRKDHDIYHCARFFALTPGGR